MLSFFPYGVRRAGWIGAALLGPLLPASLLAQSVNDGFDPNANGAIYAAVVETSGQILLAGDFTTLQPDGATSATTRNHIARVNADGTLDTSFDPDTNGAIYAVAVQSDGKILIGGDFSTIQPNGASSATVRHDIARLNADGSLDTTFDPNPSSALSSAVYAIAVQTDGRILIGGAFTALQPNGASSATTRNHLARLNADGSLDAGYNPDANAAVKCITLEKAGSALIGGAFTAVQPNGASSATTRGYIARIGADGSVDAGFDPKANGNVNAIAVEPNNQIVFGGNFTSVEPDGASGVTTRNNLARVNADGTLDSDYSPDPNGVVNALVIQSDGRTVIGGDFNGLFPSATSSSVSVGHIARVNYSDGSVDTSYVPLTNGAVQALALQSDGKLVVGGSFSSAEGSGVGTPIVRNDAARFDGSGAVDGSFDPDSVGQVLVMARQSDGKILVGGSLASVGGVTSVNLARMNADGSVDSSFAPVINGAVAVIVVQTDGRILISGGFSDVNGVSRAGLARLNADGTLDTGFNPNPNGTVDSIALEPATNQILIAGTFGTLQPNGASTASSVVGGIARLNSDGSFDSTFSPEPNSNVDAVAVQSDGMILIGGQFTGLTPNGASTATTRTYLARLKADGTVDSSYDPEPSGTVTCITLDSSGRALLGGSFTFFDPFDSTDSTKVVVRSGMARVNADGSIDGNFDPEISGGRPAQIAVESNGQVLVVGTFTTVNPYRGVSVFTRRFVARFASDGSLDTSFVPDPNGVVNAVLALSDNSFYLAGGFTYIGGRTTGHVAHFAAGGSVDTGFELSSGALTGNGVNALAVQADGKVVAAGSFSRIGGATSVNIARYGADSTPDTTFNASTDGAVNAVALLPGGGSVLSQDPHFAYLTSAGALVSSNFKSDSSVQIVGTVNVVAVQSDGKILIGGNFTNGSGLTNGNLIRLNADGSLDTTFNISALNPNGAVNALIVQSGGKIVVAGGFTNIAGTARNYMARLNSDGTIDSNFDPDLSAAVTVMTQQSDGKILVGGSFSTLQPGGTANSKATSYTRYDVARLNSDGSIDTGFNPNPSGSVDALYVQSDGKILMGGVFTSLQPNGTGSSVTRYYCARLNSDGTLDTAFDPEPNGEVTSFAQLSNGQVVIAGVFTSVQPLLGTTIATRNHIARINTDSSLDTSYDPNVDGTVDAIALESNGELLIAGAFTALEPNSALTQTTRGNIAILKTDGTVDPAFDPDFNGEVRTIVLRSDGSVFAGGAFTSLQPNPAMVIGGSFSAADGLSAPNLALMGADGSLKTGFAPAPNGAVDAMALQADGKIVVGGAFTSVSGTALNRIARLDSATGAVDTTFNPNVNGTVAALAVQPDGGVVIGGSFSSVGGTSRADLARVNSSGSVDSSFAPAVNGAVAAIVVQADGKIVIGGSFSTVAGASRSNLARLNSDGSIDGTFTTSVNGPVDSLALSTLGQIVVGGSFSTVGGVSAANLARVNGDGSVDTSFSASTDGAVAALAQEPDGKLFAGGAFSEVDGLPRFRIARLSAAAPGVQSLSWDSGFTTVTWTRAGNGPELSQVAFQYSSDDSTWSSIGSGSRVGATSSWRLGGLSYSGQGVFYIRAIGFSPTSEGGSDGVLMETAQFDAATGFTGKVVAYTASSSGGSPGSSGGSSSTSLSGGLSTGATTDTESSATTQTGTGSRLIAFSSRAQVYEGSPLVVGFTISGTGTKTVLVRGVGPSLSVYGVTDPLAAVSLTVKDSSGATKASNSGWNNDATVAADAALAGAFPLVSGSADAAAVVSLAPGSYTLEVDAANGDIGAALGEVYDADAAPLNSALQVSSVSAQGRVNLTYSLVGGFVVAGNASQAVLVTGLGPALGSSGTLANPVVSVYDKNGTLLAQDTGWGAQSTVNSAYPAASASSVSSAASANSITLASGSADSAVLLTLQPGVYTAQVTGANATTGTAKVGIYTTTTGSSSGSSGSSGSSSSSGGKSGGGGGAPSAWFLAALAALAAARLLTASPLTNRRS